MRLGHGRIYPGESSWGGRHARWLAEQAFAHPAHHIVLKEALNAARGAAEQVKRLEAALVEIVPTWSMAPVVDAFRAMRGVGFVAAVICVAELGDLRRFDHLTKDGKHTGRLRKSRASPGLQCSCRGWCWRDDWPFPLISEKSVNCRKVVRRSSSTATRRRFKPSICCLYRPASHVTLRFPGKNDLSRSGGGAYRLLVQLISARP
jgi:hypothetical protein